MHRYAPHAGIGNVVKNKGGVATGLWIYNTSMCFITAHLAAHQKNTKDRNANTQRIFENLRLHAKALTDTACNIHPIGTGARELLDLRHSIRLCRTAPCDCAFDPIRGLRLAWAGGRSQLAVPPRILLWRSELSDRHGPRESRRDLLDDERSQSNGANTTRIRPPRIFWRGVAHRHRSARDASGRTRLLLRGVYSSTNGIGDRRRATGVRGSPGCCAGAGYRGDVAQRPTAAGAQGRRVALRLPRGRGACCGAASASGRARAGVG